MKVIPLFHRCDSQRCLFVGSGKVALRKAKYFANKGIIIDVVAPTLSKEFQTLIDDSQGSWFETEFSEHIVVNQQEKYWCIVAATNSKLINANVAKLAKTQDIMVNVVDDQALCDFIFPSTIERESLIIAISNSGSSPVLSRLLTQQINMLIPDAYGELSQFVGENREKVKTAIADKKTLVSFWEHVLQGDIAEAIFSGKHQEAREKFSMALANPEKFNCCGDVSLIGAGPGDPDLLTVRALRLLQQSDIVFYDNLVSKEVLGLIRAGTELVYVGKKRDNHSVPQKDINKLLVHYAKQGKHVARLKGGDPFIFGRGGEEISCLIDENISFQVVPGITAASGCSAYAGIPLTSRGLSQSVQFVTGQLKDGSIDLNWTELVAPNKTLVFYMGLAGLSVICASLIKHGMDASMPIALVEKGTTQAQRVFTSTLNELPTKLLNEQIESPSLIIVGKVVSLSEKLQWFHCN